MPVTHDCMDAGGRATQEARVEDTVTGTALLGGLKLCCCTVFLYRIWGENLTIHG